MLPSLGYFKDIRCPFLIDGHCDRPYCHFKHTKKDQLVENDRSSLAINAVLKIRKHFGLSVENITKESTSVQKLQQAFKKNSQNKITSSPQIQQITKVTYNPTPISKLSENNKTRHIPIPYTPHRPHISSPARITKSKFEYSPGSSSVITSHVYVPSSLNKGRIKYGENETETNTNGQHSYQPTSSMYNVSNVDYVPTNTNGLSSRICFGDFDLTDEFKMIDEILRDEDKYEAVKKEIKQETSPDKNNKLTEENTGVVLKKIKKQHDHLQQQFELEKPTKKIYKDYKLETIENKKHLKSHSSHVEKHSESCLNDKHEKKRHVELKRTDKRIPKVEKKHSHEFKKDKKDKYESKIQSSKRFDLEKKCVHEKESSNHRSKSKENDCKKKTKHLESEKNRHVYELHKKSDSKSDKKYSNKMKSDNLDKEIKKQTTSENKKSDHLKKNGHKKHLIKTSPLLKRCKDKTDSKNSKISVKKDEAYGNPKIQKHYSSPVFEYADDLSDMDDIERECFEIFNNDDNQYIKAPLPVEMTESQDEIELFKVVLKKRVSHMNGNEMMIIQKNPRVIPPKLHAVLTNRFLQAKEVWNAKNKHETNTSVVQQLSKPSLSIRPVLQGRKRIAHVPNVNLLLSAKNKVDSLKVTNPVIPTTSKVSEEPIIGLHAKEENRANRPVVIDPCSQKIPWVIRMTILNNMIDVCLSKNLTVTESYEKAKNEEHAVFLKCKSQDIYKKSAALAIHRLKSVMREQLTGSLHLPKPTSTVTSANMVTGIALYNHLTKWLLTEEQLKENRFPRPHPSITCNGAAIIYNPPVQEKVYRENERVCPRCHRHYFIDADGFPCIKEECLYHPQRKYTFRGESTYSCCRGDGSIAGCITAPLHVVEQTDYSNLRGFVHTIPPDIESNQYYGIYALDCEMIYTIIGMELARVTVVDADCKVIYDTLVLPDHPIVDYNTRFSGLDAELMKQAKASLLDVQAYLLHLFNSQTILIGHSLESDFKVLKLIHDVVIDTSVLFPHRMGPPKKRSLKNLASEHLAKIIQDNPSGHSSAEDAITCMELVLFRLKESLKSGL